MSKKSHGTHLDIREQSTAAAKAQTAKSNTIDSNANFGIPPSISLNVSDVEDLYAKVNDTTNAGTLLILEKGTYLLSTNDPNSGAPRPKGGRLELQPDMQLCGVTDDLSRVIIDTSQLLDTSFKINPQDPNFRTGSIRVGCGTNVIEWLTIKGNNLAVGCIAADLDIDDKGNKYSSASIRVANVRCDSTGKANTRGVDVRNVRPTMAGRTITAQIEKCEFLGGMQGVRFANFDGADGGEVHGTTNDNVISDSRMGCTLANNRTNSAIVDVSSTSDKFTNNGLGCFIVGGIVLFSPTTTSNFTKADGNFTRFKATGSWFVLNNKQVVGDKGGIVVIGGEGFNSPGDTSHNTVKTHIEDCTIGENQEADFRAWGARNGGSDNRGVAGTHNSVTIELRGKSQSQDVLTSISDPPETFPPKPTNSVIVDRGPVDFEI